MVYIYTFSVSDLLELIRSIPRSVFEFGVYVECAETALPPMAMLELVAGVACRGHRSVFSTPCQ